MCNAIIPVPVKAQELQSKNASSAHSCDSTLEKPGVLKVLTPTTHDNSCQNINTCVVRTKQSTLVMEGNVLKVCPELAVSLRYEITFYQQCQWQSLEIIYFQISASITRFRCFR
jgi:hypothetical protein